MHQRRYPTPDVTPLDAQPVVMKFGGTSVEDAPAFARVRDIIHAYRHLRPVVVVSAMSGMTDALMACAKSSVGDDVEAAVRLLDKHIGRHEEVSRRLVPSKAPAFLSELGAARCEIVRLLRAVAASRQGVAALADEVASYGERLSSALLALVLAEGGLPAWHVDARSLIVTDDRHGNARPRRKETEHATRDALRPLAAANVIPVLGGFIGQTYGGATTTLGRGGSDYTAALVAAALYAREVQVWTDVPGVLTADPRLIERTRTVSHLSYTEATYLARFGAKVLHPKMVGLLATRGILLRVCASRAPWGAETRVSAEAFSNGQPIKAITHKTPVVEVRATPADGRRAWQFARAVRAAVRGQDHVVNLTAAPGGGVALLFSEGDGTEATLEELRSFATVEVRTGRAAVCVVGESLRDRPETVAFILKTIGRIGVGLGVWNLADFGLVLTLDEGSLAETMSHLHQAVFEPLRERIRA